MASGFLRSMEASRGPGAASAFLLASGALREAACERAEEALREQAPYMGSQGLDLSDLFGRLFHQGLVEPSSPGHSPVAQVLGWLARAMAPEGTDVVVEDRGQHWKPGSGVPLRLTTTRKAGQVAHSASLSFEAARPPVPGRVSLPTRGTMEEWRACSRDLLSILSETRP